MSKTITIGITQGDMNGIGYEVIIKALADQHITDMFVPVIYGSSKLFAHNKKLIPEAEHLSTNLITTVKDAKARRINIINCVSDNCNIEFGKASRESAEAAMASLEAAVKDLKAGDLDAIVTAPFNKQSMSDAGFQFVGHTEYLTGQFPESKSLMFLCSDTVRVGVATNHTPIAKVADVLTPQMIVERLEVMEASLKRDFLVVKPKIAVLGLNPHAGDGGLLGKEEQDVIIPAIEQAKEKGILAFGPYPADGFFGTGQYTRFDAVLAMYHDQGLIPFKTIAFENGVNFTAGLPVVRTSVDHGTGYDIAGKNMADPQSMRWAIYMAVDIVKNRQTYDEITANPLKIKVFETKSAPDRSYLPE